MSKHWNMEAIPGTQGWRWTLVPAATHLSHLKGDGPTAGVWYTLEPQGDAPDAPLDVVQHSFVARNVTDMVSAIRAAETANVGGL